MGKTIIAVGVPCNCKLVTGRELVVKLSKSLQNFESKMIEDAKQQLIAEVEQTFTGSPAACRAALLDAEARAEQLVDTPTFKKRRNEEFERNNRQILDITFSESGFTDRSVFDRVYAFVAEDTDSNVERFDKIQEVAELFVGLKNSAGVDVVRQ